MNVTVENLAPCKKLLRVEVDAQAVDEVFAAITKDFQKQASLPGFRPGKAPRDVLQRVYGSQVLGDVMNALVQSTLPKALSENNVVPITQPSVEPGKKMLNTHTPAFREGWDLVIGFRPR